MGVMTTFIPDAASRSLAVASIVAMAVALVALVIAHVRATGLSPWRNPVSQYGISSAAPWYRLQTLSMATAALALALSLGVSMRGGGLALVLASLVVFALARSVISWFPMDAPGTTRTLTGARHGVLAIVAFVAVGLAADRLENILTTLHGVSWWATATRWFAVALVVTLLIMVVSRNVPLFRRYFGLVERAFYVACSGFLLLSAVASAIARS